MRQENHVVMQGRVLFALIMREMTTRYGSNAGGYIWAVLEPAGMLALLSLVFSLVARHPALGDSFPIFFATGYLAFHFYLDISRNVSTAVTSNKNLLYFSRVTISDTIIARILLQTITLIFVSSLILSSMIIIFSSQVIINFSSIFIALSTALLLGSGVGIMNSILFTWLPTWKMIFGIINRPLFLVSGIFFLYEDLPHRIQEIIWWNPLIHITATMRAGFYPLYEPSWVSMIYVIIFAVVPFMIGVLLIRALRTTMLQ